MDFADFNADFNPGTLSDLAGQGTHGVEVIVVAALAVIVCALFVFIYRFYTEARKYDKIRDEALLGITTAVQDYTAAAEKVFEKTAESLDRIEDDLGEGIEVIKAKADANRVKIAEHETRISAAEEKIGEHDETLKTLTAAPAKAAAAKQKKRK